MFMSDQMYHFHLVDDKTGENITLAYIEGENRTVTCNQNITETWACKKPPRTV